MPEPDHDATVARDYILRNLSPDEQDTCEARYFADSAFFEVIEAVEWEMLRDLARGELSDPESRQFTAIIEESPDLQQKLATVKGLTTSEPKRVLPPMVASASSWLPGWLIRPMPAWSFAVGMVVVAAATLEYAHISLNPAQPPAVRQSSSSPESETAPAWVIPSGALRGPGETPRPVVSVQPGTLPVKFLLPIPTGAVAPTYRVILKDDDGTTEILSRAMPHPAHNNALYVEVDPTRLRPGDYHFMVSAEPTVPSEPPTTHRFIVR